MTVLKSSNEAGAIRTSPATTCNSGSGGATPCTNSSSFCRTRVSSSRLICEMSPSIVWTFCGPNVTRRADQAGMTPSPGPKSCAPALSGFFSQTALSPAGSLGIPAPALGNSRSVLGFPVLPLHAANTVELPSHGSVKVLRDQPVGNSAFRQIIREPIPEVRIPEPARGARQRIVGVDQDIALLVIHAGIARQRVRLIAGKELPRMSRRSLRPET